MTDRRVPLPPLSGAFNLTGWWDAVVKPGDQVFFPEKARYRTEWAWLKVAGNKIHGRGSTLVSTAPPPPPVAGVWKAPCVLHGSGIQVDDLFTEGPRPAGTAGNSTYQGQHGFTLGAPGMPLEDVTLCRTGSKGIYGDHVHVDGAHGVAIWNYHGETESGRKGLSIVDASDVMVQGGAINGWSTALNFEVHEGATVSDVHIENVDLAWRNMAITGTGEGDAHDIAFKDLRGAGTHKLSIQVYGTGSLGDWTPDDPGEPREYGLRTNWSIDGFTNVRTPTATKSYRMEYVDGLHLAGLPPYPMTTTGSTLVA